MPTETLTKPTAKPTAAQLRQRAARATALARKLDVYSGESRLLILLVIADHGELAVGRIGTESGLTTSTVSAGLLLFRTAGVVESRRDGHQVFYRLSADGEQVLAAIRGMVGTD